MGEAADLAQDQTSNSTKGSRKPKRHPKFAQYQAEATLFTGKAFDMQATLSTVLFAANGAGVAAVFNAILLGRMPQDALALAAFVLFAVGDWCALCTFWTLRDFAYSHSKRLQYLSGMDDADEHEKEHMRSASKTANFLIGSMLALTLGGVAAVASVWRENGSAGRVARPPAVETLQGGNTRSGETLPRK